jgi:glycosyltransferase involved in cell wall biosynthesis
MKILLAMASPADANGGMEKHFRELANGLASRGHQITCAAAKEHMAGLDESISQHPINTRASRYSPALHYDLLKLLNRQHFDIAHAQGSKAADVIKKMKLLFRRSKFIATIHNFKSKYPNSKVFCRLIVVSRALAADIGHKNITVIYNGLPPSTCLGPENELPKSLIRPVWLSAGRLVYAKGFDSLITAFQHTRGSLIIAGSGPELKNLQEQIDNCGLDHRVKLIGHCHNIEPLMKAVDAIVISSRREGFSYVFAEALITGKPIISTDVPIANEFLPKTCIIPKNSSPEKFASFLNRDLEQILSEEESARLRSKTELLFDAMIERTLGVYHDCLRS